MSCLISLNNINFQYNLEPILEGIDFSVNSGEVVAIVGHNGCGKSTLLHILSGKINTYTGERALKKGLKIEIVEQYLEKELLPLTLIQGLVQKLPREDQVDNLYLAEILLEDLFFTPDEFDTNISDLSGGGQNRLMFARSIINNPDLVFMDEPTNHLDLKSLLFIETYIKTKASFAAVVVSHDQRFLGNISNKTIILRDKKSMEFNLDYKNALIELEKSDLIAKKQLELEEKEISRIKKSAKRLAEWGRTFDNEDLSKKAKSMEKRALKLEDEKTFVSGGNPYELDLSFEKINSKFVFQMANTDIYYGNSPEKNKSNILFHIENFHLKSGEKLAVLGANGAGTSTFIKTVVNKIEQEQFDQFFRPAPNIELGLFDQEQLVLNPKKKIHNEMARLTEKSDYIVKNTLIRAGFDYKRHHVLVETLSGGEKSRLIFCALYLQKPNFLILDEPTNHIDLDGKEELAESLKQSHITALVTGHDRHFIEEVADRYVLIEDNKLTEIESPQVFYDSLFEKKVMNLTVSTLEKESVELDDDQDGLERILELEQLIEDDNARKPKFQKPKNQQLWKEELERLYLKVN